MVLRDASVLHRGTADLRPSRKNRFLDGAQLDFGTRHRAKAESTAAIVELAPDTVNTLALASVCAPNEMV